MFKWVKSGTKNVSENIVDGGKSLLGTESIAEASYEIKNMAKKVLSPKDMLKNAKKETFKDAIFRQGVSEVDLMQIYKNYTYVFYSSVLFAVILFAFLIYKLFFKHEILISVSLLVFFVFCLANAFKFSFRSFQIKHQKLCGVKEWWDRPNEWFPPLN